MSTKMKKITDELVAPSLPGAIDNNAVKTAATGVQNARNAVTNMTYDNFKSGDIYKGLQRDFQQQGRTAMKDTLGQVAARTGGMASSYATSAANQSYNNYMQALEDAARSEFNNEYSRTRDAYDMALREYDTAYGEYRDRVGDAWSRYNAANENYWKNRDYEYKVGRDAIEDGRYEDGQKKDRVSTQKADLYNLIISGGTPNRADFPDLTDADWNTITATATNTYNSTNKEDYLASVRESAAAGMLPAFDPNNKWGVTIDEFNNALGLGEADYKNSAGYLSKQKATDDSIRSMLTSESFDWDTYDWNGDAEGLGSAADYFAGKGSAYDSGYWQGIYNDAQQGYADADTKEAQDEVIEILKAGGTPDTALLERSGWLTGDVKDDNKDGIPDEIPAGLTGAARTLWQNNIDSKTDADTEAAQRDVGTIWTNGGSPTQDQLKAAGYLNEDGTLNEIGMANKNQSQATSKQNYLDTITENAANGIEQTFDPNNPWGVTEADFKNAYDVGQNMYKNSVGYLSGQKATDDTIRSMITSKDFDWDTYDWNGDKEGLGSAADYFASKDSAYGADYWQNVYNEAQSGYAEDDTQAAQDEVIAILKAGGEPSIDLLIKAGWLEEDTSTGGETPGYDMNGDGIPDGLTGLAKTMWQNNIDAKNEADAKETEKATMTAQDDAVNDINARIANGESLEDIAEAYGIDGENKTWESVTGMSKAEWQQRYNDNKTSKYHFADTNEGRANIVSKMLSSGTLKLSAGDQANFDYLYGDGSYDAVQDFISSITPNGTDSDSFANHKNFHTHTRSAFEEMYNRVVEALMVAVPGLDYLQVLGMVEKANPEMYKAATNLDTYPFADRYS